MNPTFFPRFRRRARHLSLAVTALISASTASADDLLQIYNLAVTNDPQIRQARATFNASHTLLDQGKSFLLPTIGITGSASRDTQGLDDRAHDQDVGRVREVDPDAQGAHSRLQA